MVEGVQLLEVFTHYTTERYVCTAVGIGRTRLIIQIKENILHSVIS